MTQTERGVDDNRLDEWKTARELLRQFDDRIHDLRKYGFSVVTALLSINSFLFTATVAGLVAPPPDQSKVAAIGAIMLLIVALQYMERNYQMFLRAAAIRARILERNLNLELTEDISYWYKRDKLWIANLVYLFFAFAAFGLGLAVVPSSFWRWVLVLLVSATAFAILMLTINVLDFLARYFKHGKPIDVTIDRLRCNQGDHIIFTLTKLESDTVLAPGSVALQIETQDGSGTYREDFRLPAPGNQTELGEMDNYVWSWDTKDVPADTYRVVPYVGGEPSRPLRRRIIVGPATERGERREKIAVLGWGSLVWNPAQLKVSADWQRTGPRLPVEFARISEGGRLTLVLRPESNQVPVLWAASLLHNLEDAIDNLAKREGTRQRNIGWVSLLDHKNCARFPEVIRSIEEWTQHAGLDAVVWTDLPENFKDKTGQEFTQDNVIQYLRGLDEEARAKAREYVVKAPSEISTPIRQRIELDLGWRVDEIARP